MDDGRAQPTIIWGDQCGTGPTLLRRFHAPQSNIYFLAVVSGLYDLDRLPSFQDAGVDLSALPTEDAYQPAETEKVAAAQVAYNPHEIPSAIIEDLLQGAPELVARDAALCARKNAEPTPIITIVVTLWLLTSNPFLKKFQERLGWFLEVSSLCSLAQSCERMARESRWGIPDRAVMDAQVVTWKQIAKRKGFSNLWRAGSAKEPLAEGLKEGTLESTGTTDIPRRN